MSDSDLELLKRWRDGNAAAGEALFERHFDAVFRFIRNAVGDPAEDLVQDAFLACVRGRDRFRGDASFRTYLFAAARNIVYEHLRRRNRGEPVDLEEASAHDLGPSPASLLERREHERLLVKALRRLPLSQQMALELYYVEGLKSREVAEVLEIPHPTVRSRLRRGLAEVREWVERLAESKADFTSTVSRLDAWAQSLRGEDAP